jgi:hypothetical protein
MNIRELVKIANKLDRLGLTKEADELDGIIHAALNKSATSLETYEGSGLQASEDKRDATVLEENKAKITSELNKTYSWFKNMVFPAVESGKWPVVADQDYLVAPESSTLHIPREDSPVELKPWNNNGTYIKKGTKILGLKNPLVVHRSAGGDSYGTYSTSLSQLYSEFENDIVNYDLHVTIESFN